MFFSLGFEFLEPLAHFVPCMSIKIDSEDLVDQPRPAERCRATRATGCNIFVKLGGPVGVRGLWESIGRWPAVSPPPSLERSCTAYGVDVGKMHLDLPAPRAKGAEKHALKFSEMNTYNQSCPKCGPVFDDLET